MAMSGITLPVAMLAAKVGACPMCPGFLFAALIWFWGAVDGLHIFSDGTIS